ncbi:MAG: VOC family protein [Woeseiaceae bacterium]
MKRIIGQELTMRMPYRFWIILVLAITACSTAPTSVGATEMNRPITVNPWQEAVVSVSDLDRSAAFFLDIGGYTVSWRGPLSASEIRSWGLSAEAFGEALLLTHQDSEQGAIRLIRFDNAGRQEPTRPGGHAWDTGCYFSLMIRMKDIQAIYDNAIRLGWWNETPITYLEFGASKLNIMIFKGPDGLQVQGYERLSPALPAAVGSFDRMSRPFNIMQMVRNRDASYDFFTRILGFDTFHSGKPYLASTPAHNPIGIPINLTTSSPYLASIVYPKQGEFGRMEMIEIQGIDGYDFSSRCDAPNLGILAVRFEVDDLKAAQTRLAQRDWPLYREPEVAAIAPYGNINLLSIRTPDHAIVQFYEKATP